MKKYLLVVPFFCLCILFSASGQDIHFSQYNLTPLLVNPAQAGAYKALEVTANYKSQWSSISPNAPYQTMMLSYDGRFNQKKWKTRWLALGVNLFNDKAGDGGMRTMQGNISFGYHTQLSQKSTLGGCLVGGYAMRSIDYSKLTWDEQYVNGAYNPSASSNEPVSSGSYGFADFGLGVLYQYTKGQMYSSANDMVIVHVGAAATHLNSPQYSFYANSKQTLYPKITGHFEALIGIKNSNLSLIPGLIYNHQGPSSEVLPGCYFRYMLKEESKFTGYVKGASIMIGTHYRVKDAFIPSVQFEMAEYTIGISYDFNVSNLTTATSAKGGFEISLRYGNPNPFLFKSAASFQ